MRITLRPFEDTDLPLLRRWLYESHVARWYEHPAAWLYEAERRDGEYRWIRHFIAEAEGAPVGFCQFYEYCRSGETWHGDIDTDGAYGIDYLIGDTENLGKGLGREMILALLERISACGGARLVIVQPDGENRASCGALRSVGFAFDEGNRLFRYDYKRTEP